MVSVNSIASLFHSAIVNDALGIYTTYIALNALSPVDIPDEMRQRVEGDRY